MTERNSKSRAICILGMHRSGTSAITRAINLLGAYLGEENDIFPALDYNPEGIWERKDFNGLQESLLAAIKRTWDTGLPLPAGWKDAPEVKPFRDEIARLIGRNFTGVSLWAWKDPRSTIFIDLWKDILDEIGIDLSAVFAIRNPLDVARSLQRRDGFSPDKGFGIWFNYNIIALQAVREIPAVFVSYDGFLADWEAELRRIARDLKIAWPQDEAELREKMNSFVRPDLRHSSSTMEDLERSGAPEPVVELYGLFQRLLAGDPLDSPSNQATVKRLWYSFFSYARFYRQDVAELWERQTTVILRDRQLMEKDRQLIQYDKQLFLAKNRLSEKERQIAEANRQLSRVSEMDRRLSEMESRLEEKDLQLAEKGRRLTEVDQRTNELVNSLSWRITAPLRRLAQPFMTRMIKHH